MFDKVPFDENIFDAVVRDITKNITSTNITISDLNNIEKKLKRDIDSKSYNIPDLVIVMTSIKDNINKKIFTKKDVQVVAKEVKRQKATEEVSKNPFASLEGLSIMDKVMAVLTIIFKTIIGLVDDFVVLLVSIFIILNLFFRSNVNSAILYPSNPNAFPYVFFDKFGNTKQTFLTSSIETNLKDSEDDVFLDTPAFFTSDGKYDIKKNVCKINDPYGVTAEGETNLCDKKIATDVDLKDFMKPISSENLNFFARKFMETNSERTTNDLSLYGMLCFVMLSININANGSMQSVDSFFSSIFKKIPGESTPFHYIIFAFFTFLFYNMFQNTKYTFADLFAKIFPFRSNMESRNAEAVDSFVKLISGIFAPFMLFFKFFFLFVYPLILFHSTFAYVNYSIYASGLLVKLFCYLGVAFSLMMFLTHFGLMIHSIQKKNISIDAIFASIIKEFVDLINVGVRKLTNILPKKNLEGMTSGIPSICNLNEMFGISFITNIFRSIGMMILTPILIIFFTMPTFVALYMTFDITKSVTLDFFNYAKILICEMKQFQTIIRAFFWILVMREITRYMDKPMKVITIGILISVLGYDAFQNVLKQTLKKNKCFPETTNNTNNSNLNVDINEKLSDLIMTNINTENKNNTI